MHILPELPYSPSSLEPFIDTQTMTIHHEKHHASYVDNLNKALEVHPEFQNKEAWDLLSNLDAIPEDIRTKVKNNGGGHANHSFFWKLLCPQSESGTPSDAVKQLIEKNFTDMTTFQTKFKEAALSRFGSGWVWLVLTDKDTLEITSTANQDTPWMEGKDAILGLDVWEHAYYLKYQNKRPDYVDAWWNIINWKQVEDNLAKAISYLKA